MQNQKKLEQSLSTAAWVNTTVPKPGFSKTISEMEKASGVYGSGISHNKIQLQLHAKKDCSVAESANIFKTVSTSNAPASSVSSTSSTAAAIQSTHSIQGREKSSIDTMVQSQRQQQLVGDNKISKTNIPPDVIITKPNDGGNLMGLIESKFGNTKSAPCSRDTTPSNTPAVSPSPSPQMGRRSGNPFFTPSSNAPGSVSWLFRPPQPDMSYSSEGDVSRDNILYETKVQVNPTTNAIKKSYVPRPSKLRELNFWSPTTM